MKKRGRPQVEETEARVHSVACKLTTAELVRLDRMRAGNSRGAWLRLAAFGAAPRPVPEINLKKWAELARLHSNLHQINKRLREGYMLAGPQLDQLRDLLPALYQAVTQLRADMIGQTADEAEG